MNLQALTARIDALLPADRRRLRGRLRSARPEDIASLARQLADAEQRLQDRQSLVPRIIYPDELPVSQRRDEISAALKEHQIIVVCGETGSGKTTQLPKICLEAGRGIRGLIGHTQPRRIAARSVATRVAEELGVQMGRQVGYKVRFGDQTGPQTLVKVMTDGILLSETQSDRLLEQYDTIIIDEAHERSLNIDFLLGYLKTLLPKRPDLKIIITSATIDPDRFARHFNTHRGMAPIIMVSGRTYPVDLVYRPLEEMDDDDREEGLQGAILQAVDHVAMMGAGDILIFLSGEREIREAAESLRKHHVPGAPSTIILPLYAKLSAAEQMRVFQPHEGRRIVLSTNVAETSLTVPGIRFVIDSGYARIGRYSPRTKVQRLEVEAISRASADQRKGRCGRIGPGICVRLYSERDYLGRPLYTEPEILRTNLASVILQMISLRLGDPSKFPFIDPPEERLIRDGYETLHELGAATETFQLTPMGAALAKLPIDPRIARMIIAGAAEGVLAETLIIAAALSVQDPRERPMDAQDRADQAHAVFRHPQSDFASFINLWKYAHEQKRHLSGTKFRAWCKDLYLSFVRLREWEDIHRQLAEMVGGLGLGSTHLERAESPRARRATRRGLPPPREASAPRRAPRDPLHTPDPNLLPALDQPAPPPGPHVEAFAQRLAEQPATGQGQPRLPSHRQEAPIIKRRGTRLDAIHRALLTGLLSNIGVKSDQGDYTGPRAMRFHIFPGSALFKTGPKWAMAAEIVRTTKLYARTVGGIDPLWLESLAHHVIKRSYFDPHWNRDAGKALAYERVNLYGLEVAPKRRVHYGSIDPVHARELMIYYALIEGDVNDRPEFLQHNLELARQFKVLEVRSRRQSILVDSSTLFAFYDLKLPQDIVSFAQLERWRHLEERTHPRALHMKPQDLVAPGARVPTIEDFPDALTLGVHVFPLTYRLDAASEKDGLTVKIPVENIQAVPVDRFGWLVPGWVEDKVEHLLKSLPKDFRRMLPPPATLAPQVAADMPFGVGSFDESLSRALRKLTTIDVPAEAIARVTLPDYLRMRFEVIGGKGEVVAEGRDLLEIRKALAPQLRTGQIVQPDPRWTKEGLKTWDFGALPQQVMIDRFGVTVVAFPALIDKRSSVSMRLYDSATLALEQTHAGVRRLFALEAAADLKRLTTGVPQIERMALQFAAMGSSAALRAGLADLIAERAFMDDGQIPRTEKDFAQRLTRGMARLNLGVREVMEVAERILNVYAIIHQALAGPIPPAWTPAVTDIRDQLAAMLPPTYFSDTPWDRLKHIPRYLQAIVVRLQRLAGGGIPRDAALAAQVAPLWKGGQELLKRQHELGLNPQLVSEYRWMVEELRVSLFAQELRTPVPVSVKRLQDLWVAAVKV